MLFAPRGLPGARAGAEPCPCGLREVKRGFPQVPGGGEFSGSGEAWGAVLAAAANPSLCSFQVQRLRHGT